MSALQDRLRELKPRMPIDRTRLDEECAGQAVLYNEVGEIVAELKRDARTAKDFVDRERSRIRKEIRENPGAHGISKLTESALEDGVNTHPDYLKACQQYAEAQYLSDLGASLITSAEERKSMIKDAVTLYIHEYYSTKDDLAPQKSNMQQVTEDGINRIRRQAAQEQQSEARNDAQKEENTGVGSNERE